MKGIWRFLALIVALSALSNPIPASAHPELVFYIDTSATFHTKNNRLFLDYYIAKSDQFAFSDLALATGGLSGYANEECDAAERNFEVQTGDFSIPFERRFASAVEKFPGTGAGVWVWCRFSSEVEFYEEITFTWSDSNFLDTPGHREFNIGLGSSPSFDLTDYGKVLTLLRQLDADFEVEFSKENLGNEQVVAAKEELVIEEEVVVLKPELPKAVEEAEEKSWLTELSNTYFRSINPSISIVLIGIVLALILGAFHSIAPGHGKSIMAVLALAERGERREINRLGLTMGATHTFGVFVLGTLFILGSNFVPASIIPTLGLISGVLIILIGGYYLLRFIKHRNEHRDGLAHHHYEPVSSGRIALLGVVGGMVPTPTALTVLVGTVALGSAWYGVLLVTSYGIGMTAVLILAGRIVERLYRFAEGMTGSNRGVRALVDFAPALAASIQLLAGSFLVAISYGALI